MPTYRVTGPDGHTYKVQVPEGTTQDEVMAEVEKQAGAAPPKEEVPNLTDLEAGASLAIAPAWRSIPTTVAEAREALEPREGFETSSTIPFMPAIRKTPTPGDPWHDIRPDIGGLRPLLQGGLDLLEGTGQATSVGGPEAPLAGKVSPEATGTLLAGRLSRPWELRGPRQNTLAPREPFGPPPPPPEPFGPPPPPPSPEFIPPGQPGTQLPRILELIRQDEQVAANKPAMIPPRSTTDPVTGRTEPIQQPPPVPEVEPPGPAPRQNTLSPPPPPQPSPAAPTAAAPSVRTPTTAAEATAVANTWYKLHEDAGGAKLPTDFTNNFIDTIRRIAPQTEEGLAFAGETEITKLIGRAEGLRDKPISLAGAQEIDEALGALIDKQYGIKGLSKEGEQLLELQHEFREQLMNAAPAGDAGAVGGVEALKQGRRAWMQSRKMDDLERIQNRAQIQDHPDTGIRSQIRTLLDNKKRIRGYSEEEKAALRRAANRGVLGGTMHVFGSRLVPLIAGGSGLATGGLPGMLINAGIGHGISSGMRFGATGLANRRVNRAMRTLGSSVPMPTNQMMPPP